MKVKSSQTNRCIVSCFIFTSMLLNKLSLYILPAELPLLIVQSEKLHFLVTTAPCTQHLMNGRGGGHFKKIIKSHKLHCSMRRIHLKFFCSYFKSIPFILADFSLFQKKNSCGVFSVGRTITWFWLIYKNTKLFFEMFSYFN